MVTTGGWVDAKVSGPSLVCLESSGTELTLIRRLASIYYYFWLNISALLGAWVDTGQCVCGMASAPFLWVQFPGTEYDTMGKHTHTNGGGFLGTGPTVPP